MSRRLLWQFFVWLAVRECYWGYRTQQEFLLESLAQLQLVIYFRMLINVIEHDKHRSISIMEKPRKKRGINKVEDLPIGESVRFNANGAAVGFVAKTAWAGAAYNLLLYMLASHVLGATWYLMSIGRQHSCWQQGCKEEMESKVCISFLDCNSVNQPDRKKWLQSTGLRTLCDASNESSPFKFGMFADAFTSEVASSKFFEKYLYCLWWGLRNLSSYGQNLDTSIYIGETLFCSTICIGGLILFAQLIGNMHTYLQSMTVRLEEWRIKKRDTEEWMRHRQLPQDLQDRIRRFVQYKWLATRGVDEEAILQSLPIDLRREIQRHLDPSLQLFVLEYYCVWDPMAETRREPETVELNSFFSAALNDKIDAGNSVIVQPYDQPKYLARVTRISYARLTKSTEVEVRRYYAPKETVAGRHTFYGYKELLLTNLVDTVERPDELITGVIFVHSFVDYTRLETVGEHDYFCRFEYDTEQGWLSPAIVSLFCKCRMPFNPDMFTLKCEACKERYHPACINMTLDEAKQLADNFTCFDCLTPDNQGSASAATATVDLSMV